MHIEKKGRYWSVYDNNGTFICLTVYKKGAREVIRRLQALEPDRTTVSGAQQQLSTASIVTATQRRHWRRVLAIAAALMEEEGDHTAYLMALSDFVAQLPEEAQPCPSRNSCASGPRRSVPPG